MKKLMLALTVAGFAQSASAGPLGPFDDLLVFGDSLSDPGNYGSPLLQATNGDVWAAQLGADAASGSNFAYGSAQAFTNSDAAPDFALQRDFFEASVDAGLILGDNPLVSVWFGGNDLIAGLLTNPTSSDPVTSATDAIRSGVQALIDDYGFDDFALFNLPDFGQIPLFAGTALAGFASAATDSFNSLINGIVSDLSNGGVTVTLVDVAALSAQIAADPGAFGFINATETCDRGAISCDDLAFWDGIHPTEAAHALIAAELVDTVTPIPLPAGAPLLLFALGTLGVATRRLRRG